MKYVALPLVPAEVMPRSASRLSLPERAHVVDQEVRGWTADLDVPGLEVDHEQYEVANEPRQREHLD